MGKSGLSDIYTQSPWACGPRALGVYIQGGRTRTHAPQSAADNYYTNCSFTTF